MLVISGVHVHVHVTCTVKYCVKSLGAKRIRTSIEVGLAFVTCARQLWVERDSTQERNAEIVGHLLSATRGWSKDLSLRLETRAEMKISNRA